MSIEHFNLIYQTFVERIPDYITDTEKLKEYISFCLTNNNLVKIKGLTSYHHILPQSKSLPFTEFSSLYKHKWNGTHLSFYNHYYSHFLLQQAVNHPSILYSFIAMHNKDYKIGRIHEDELIPQDTFNELMKQRNENISKDKLELVLHNGVMITKAKRACQKIILTEQQLYEKHARMAGCNNIVNKDGVVDKIRQTKINTFIDGKNLDKISAERAADTMNKVFINENGDITTIYKQNAKKLSEFCKTTVNLPDGTITTMGQLRSVKSTKYKRDKSKIYIVKNVFNDLYCEYIPAYELRKISADLQSKTKENYLGKSNIGKSTLIRTNRSHLIGLYVEEL